MQPLLLNLSDLAFVPDLPTPVSGGIGLQHGESAATGYRKYRPMNLADLFVAPMFDELDAVAMDGTGELKRLNNSQLKTLREQGFVLSAK